MCYSLQVETSIPLLQERFKANASSKTKLFFMDGSYKSPDESGKVFKNYYCPAIIWRGGDREVVPLRFNLLPRFCDTDKYKMIDKKTEKSKELSTYNAKIENIRSARAYKHLVGSFHCVIPIKGFYEWGVDNQGIKKNYLFKAPNSEFLFAAGLWDHWNRENMTINSFSIITTPPRPEVAEIGHQRSPLLLPENSLNSYIDTANLCPGDFEVIVNEVDSRILRWESVS